MYIYSRKIKVNIFLRTPLKLTGEWLRPLYLLGNRPLSALNRRLGGPDNWSGRFGE